jgi:uncharacterized protein YndB with AHSA1/START domain
VTHVSGDSVEVRQLLSAAPERVFAAFSEPHLVSQWLTPSPEVRLSVLQLDFREGGSYRFAYDPPGQRTVIVGGIFRSIDRPSRIVFSWVIEAPDEHAGIDSEVTVTITPCQAGSELVIRHAKLARPDAMARHAEGWRGALAQLSVWLEEDEAHVP